MSKWSLFFEITSQSQERKFFNLKVIYVKQQTKTCHLLQFFVSALASEKIICLASKQGFSQWDWQQKISRVGWICVLQRVAVSGEDISTTEESKWKKLVEHQKEHVRMDSRGYIGTYIRRNMTTVQTYRIKFTLDLSVQIIKYLDWSKSNIRVD